jgi:hypothetical protein
VINVVCSPDKGAPNYLDVGIAAKWELGCLADPFSRRLAGPGRAVQPFSSDRP